MSRQVLLFLYGRPNIVGSLLGLLGLLLYFSGVIKSYWLPIVIGLYTIGVVITPRQREYHLKLSQEMDVEAIHRSLEELVAKIRKHVAPEIVDKVESIKQSIGAILPQIADASRADEAAFNVRQTALSYLPETLEGYLRLPPAFARFHTIKDGKTPKQILLEQLDLMDERMKQIVSDFHRNDADRLLAHGRFLESKFRQTSLFD